jgi:hypothetical protein
MNQNQMVHPGAGQYQKQTKDGEKNVMERLQRKITDLLLLVH